VSVGGKTGGREYQKQVEPPKTRNNLANKKNRRGKGPEGVNRKGKKRKMVFTGTEGKTKHGNNRGEIQTPLRKNTNNHTPRGAEKASRRGLVLQGSRKSPKTTRGGKKKNSAKYKTASPTTPGVSEQEKTEGQREEVLGVTTQKGRHPGPKKNF